jgi:hypothetical protein
MLILYFRSKYLFKNIETMFYKFQLSDISNSDYIPHKYLQENFLFIPSKLISK